MNEIIAKIDGGDLVFLALAALFTLGYMVHRVCAAFEPADEVDEDEFADRIEAAIRDATTDLLDALNHANATLDAIRDSNQAILDDEDADAVRYQPAANIGSNLHRMIFDEMATTRRERPPYAGSPDHLWVDDAEAERVDLRKPE